MESKQILRQIRGSKWDRAIFLIQGEWRTIRADGVKLTHMLETHANECMGVYTVDCPEEYVEEDIIFMESRRI